MKTDKFELDLSRKTYDLFQSVAYLKARLYIFVILREKDMFLYGETKLVPSYGELLSQT